MLRTVVLHGLLHSVSICAIVADGLVMDCERQELLQLLVADEFSPAPPEDRWEKATVDDASAPQPTWGLRRHVLDSMAGQAAVNAVQTRLQQLYPNLQFFHMPADKMCAQSVDHDTALKPESRLCQAQSDHTAHCAPELRTPAATNTTEAVITEGSSSLHTPQKRKRQQAAGEALVRSEAHQDASDDSPLSDCHGASAAELTLKDHISEATQCCNFVGNAAVHGDDFAWHVDADPTQVPDDCPWAQAFGQYANRVCCHGYGSIAVHNFLYSGRC